MNELTLAFETASNIIGDHLGLFVGIPTMFITGHIAVSLVKIMCNCGCNNRRRPVCVAERQRYIRGEKKYTAPELNVETCPVSEECEKCRFYKTASCLRGYLYG